jgi:biotin operon repressor
VSDALNDARHALETRAAELELVGELERRMDAALSALAGDALPEPEAPPDAAAQEARQVLLGLGERLEQQLEALRPLVEENRQIHRVLTAIDPEAYPDQEPRRARRRGPATGEQVERVRAALAERPHSRKELGELLGLSRSRVSALLGPLEDAGEIVGVRASGEQGGEKLWQLAGRAAEGAQA